MFHNLICSCAYELLYWKHVHMIKNKERNEAGNERILWPVEKARE